MNKAQMYHSPMVLKSIPLEMESQVLAESKVVKSTSIEAEGQYYESYDPSKDNSFSFTWQ